MTETEIRTLLTTKLAARLGIDPASLDPQESFSRYGLDSAGATGLIAELSAELGIPLSPTLVWAHPTPEELARHLARGETAPSAPAVRPVRAAATAEPIAIVGMACRFPMAPSPQAFWRMLCDGVDTTREVPADRWNADAWYDPDPQAPGTINTRRGAFLDRVDLFDPLFFGISPREAVEMDPQQRLLLEMVWEALEDAGIPPRSLAGSRTGVFVGSISRDYGELHRMRGATVTSHTGPGTSMSIVSNRVSYALGLRGPSLTIDTACSSSLVAVHEACKSLRDGESALAFAGGINLILLPELTVELTKFGGLSGDGRCKAFDARANGFARGEGGGVVLLKTLSRALADGDRIYCLIRGGAVNNDGASNGLTAPNPQAQAEVLTDAYARAGVDPGQVHYVEAHGTGTRLGDPIEARALSEVLCADRDPARPLVIGSAKTNIAHQEGAAGIAGLLKLALAIHHRAIPPSLHFETPNPDIPFEELRLRVATSLLPWPSDEPAVGGVSSFGWGGTNCHVVLAELPESRAFLLPLAAESVEELRELARETAKAPSPGWGAGGWERAGVRAREGEHRLSISVRSRRELGERLDAFLAGQARPGLAVGRAGEASRLVFVFSGMGSQWPGMARDLLREEPLFHAHLSRIDRALRPGLGWSVLDEIAAGTGERWSEAGMALPLLFAVEASLADLWRSWGIEPDAVVGHSFGEVVAAYVAGALDLEQAAQVTVHYCRALAQVDGRGALGVAELAPEETKERIAAGGLRLEVAGWLSPSSTTVAGEPGEVDAFVAAMKAEGRFAARVNAHAAAHTSALDPFLPAMREALAGLGVRTPAVPLISTLTGGPPDRPLDGDYWADNLRNPVLLAQAVEHLLGEGYGLFLAVDPHPVLATPLEQCFASAAKKTGGDRARVLPSLRRQEDARAVLFDSLGALWAVGRPVRWERLSPDADAEGPPELLPLSARTPEALADLARASAAALRAPGQGTLRDAGWTAAARRSHQEHRLAMVARSRAEMAAKLDAWAGGEPVAGAAAARAGRERPRVVFAFSGQGPQWKGMGWQLFREEPRFRKAVEQCDRLLRPWLGFSVLARVEAEEDALDHTEVVQPALFSLQVGLTALWRSWGIEPDAVVGHSIGEVAAAWASGALSLEEAARVVALRGRSMEPARGLGKMAAVELPEAEVRAALAGFGDRLAVAAVNAPSSTTVAGDPQALEELTGKLQETGATCRMLRVDYAFHTAQMEPYDAELEAALADLRPRPSTLPFVSTVTGARAAGTDLGASYWRRNVREPVRFADAAGTLEEEGYGLFLEIGPHPVLAASIAQIFDTRGREAAVQASLRRGRDERETLLEALGTLYALGSPIDWREVHPDGGRLVRLPTYPFQRQRYWFEAERSAPGNVGLEAAPDTGVERLLAEQLDAFNRMVAQQLDVLGRNDL